MSILQEYEKHSGYIGRRKLSAIDEYIKQTQKTGRDIYYSDIIYKKVEWDKFEKWYKEAYNNKYGKSSKRN